MTEPIEIPAHQIVQEHFFSANERSRDVKLLPPPIGERGQHNVARETKPSVEVPPEQLKAVVNMINDEFGNPATPSQELAAVMVRGLFTPHSKELPQQVQAFIEAVTIRSKQAALDYVANELLRPMIGSTMAEFQDLDRILRGLSALDSTQFTELFDPEDWIAISRLVVDKYEAIEQEVRSRRGINTLPTATEEELPTQVEEQREKKSFTELVRDYKDIRQLLVAARLFMLTPGEDNFHLASRMYKEVVDKLVELGVSEEQVGLVFPIDRVKQVMHMPFNKVINNFESLFYHSKSFEHWEDTTFKGIWQKKYKEKSEKHPWKRVLNNGAEENIQHRALRNKLPRQLEQDEMFSRNFVRLLVDEVDERIGRGKLSRKQIETIGTKMLHRFNGGIVISITMPGSMGQREIALNPAQLGTLLADLPAYDQINILENILTIQGGENNFAQTEQVRIISDQDEDTVAMEKRKGRK